jgi:hypothetical protein
MRSRGAGPGHEQPVVKQESSRSTLAMSGRQRRTPVRRMGKAVPAVGGPLDQPVSLHL